MEKSCLVEKLSYYVEIDDVDERYLRDLEEVERNVSKKQEICHEGDALDYLYVVKIGWFYSYVDLSDGRRQITRIYHPGDVIGFPDIAFTAATTNIKAAESGCLCPFPKGKLDVIFRQSPRLTALLFSIANRDYASLIDLIRAAGRMTAKEKLCYLLLDLHARLKITNKDIKSSFRIPLTQSEIGDILGLTHTYVSKTLMDLQRDGLIMRNKEEITISNFPAMIDATQFQNRYVKIDTTWFPA